MANARGASILRAAFVALAVQALSSVDASMAMALTLTSSAFQAGGKIPSQYTCEGEDISPPLAIDGVPGGAKSLALIIDDPDAPDPKAPKRVWVHWVVHNLPPDTQRPTGECGQRGLADGRCYRHERPEAEFLSRPVPAHRAASLFPQALCAGYHVASRAADEGCARGCHAGSCARASRADGDLSKGRSVGDRGLPPRHLTVAFRLA